MADHHEILTKRFRLRKIDENDYDFLCHMYSDPEVMQFISTGVCSPELTKTLHQEFLDHWKAHGYGMWIVESCNSSKKLGYGGFRRLKGKEGVEFVGLLIKEAWGRRIPDEVGLACLLYGFRRFDFQLIYSVIDPNNLPSKMAAQRLGMKRNEAGDGIYHQAPMHYFSMNKFDFQKGEA